MKDFPSKVQKKEDFSQFGESEPLGPLPNICRGC